MLARDLRPAQVAPLAGTVCPTLLRDLRDVIWLLILQTDYCTPFVPTYREAVLMVGRVPSHLELAKGFEPPTG